MLIHLLFNTLPFKAIEYLEVSAIIQQRALDHILRHPLNTTMKWHCVSVYSIALLSRLTPPLPFNLQVKTFSVCVYSKPVGEREVNAGSHGNPRGSILSCEVTLSILCMLI